MNASAPPNDPVPAVGHSRLMALRGECVERFGGHLALPVLDSLPRHLRSVLPPGRVLDVGAGAAKPMKTILRLEDDRYETLDIDPAGAFTYRSWSDVPAERRYAFIVANQVIEHLDDREAEAHLRQVAAHLEPHGLFACTVPNLFHPTAYWRDPTHRTPWTYRDLYAACVLAGLDVTGIWRYGRQRPKGLVNRLLARRIASLFTMDWCDYILLVARRAARGEGGADAP